jgi:hypothetical protein
MVTTAFDHTLQQVVAINRLHVLFARKEAMLEHIHFGQARFRQNAHGAEKHTTHPAGQAVGDTQAFLFRLDQTRSVQN